MNTKIKIPLFYILFSLAGLFAIPQTSIAPGIYRENIVIRASSLHGGEMSYSFNRDGPFLPFLFPLELSALEGEERQYTLFLRERFESGSVEDSTIHYVIDRQKPKIPVLIPVPGLYPDSLVLDFEDNQDSIFYSINGASYSEWNQTPFSLKNEKEEISRYLIKAYSRDDAGNVSKSIEGVYYIKSSGSMNESVPFVIKSPVPGTFANRQLLYVENSSDYDIFYTLDNSDPDMESLLYSEPVIIERSGDIVLKMAAFDRSAKKTYESKVIYAVSRAEGRMVSRGSGIFTAAVQVEPTEQNLVYTLNDTRPSDNSLPFTQQLRLSGVRHGKVLYPLQVSPVIKGKASGIVFRYFYIIDSRIPGPPRFVLHGTLPLNKTGFLSMIGEKSSRLYYTLDGSGPTRDSLRYDDGIRLPVPEDHRSYYIRGISIDENGRTSEETAFVVTFDLKAPDKPEPVVEPVPGGYRVLVKKAFGTRLVYEIGWDASVRPPVPNIHSPEWNGDIITVPAGMKGQPVLSFAYIDEAGNISEEAVISLLVNNSTVPAPDIRFDGKLCSIHADNKVFYEVFDGVITSVAGKPVETAYARPFSLNPVDGKAVSYTIAAYQIDESGMYSSFALKTITVDNRIPVVPEILNIKNHMAYTDSPIRLKLGPADAGISFHYTISTDGVSPPDPDASSPLIDNLVIETPPGEEYIYYLKILPYIAETVRTGEIREYMFVVDRKPPQLPSVTGFIDGSVYNQKVGISLSGTGEGNTAYLSISKDGSDPGEPVIFGTPYTDTVYINPEEGRRLDVRVRIGIQDPAGNTATDPREYRFTIDRERPSTPVVDGLPAGGISRKPLSLSIQSAGKASVFYRLGRQEEWPLLGPDKIVPYTTPVYVSGRPGEKSLYYFEVYVYDAAGNSLLDPSRHSFILDLTEIREPEKPEIKVMYGRSHVEWQTSFPVEYSVDGFTYEPYTIPFLLDSSVRRLFYRYAGSEKRYSSDIPLSGDPPQNVYSGVENASRHASAVVVRPGTFDGIVRYETGTNSVIKVGPLSPVFSGPLEYNVPHGMSRNFTISFSWFSSQDSLTGIPLPSLSFTIDKSPPAAPGIRETIQGSGASARKVVDLYGEGTIYYRFIVPGKEPSYDRYTQSIILPEKSESREAFRIEAYCENSLGNRSPVKSWDIIIDHDIVYVSVDGDDYHDGSRNRPVKTLEQAIILAREQGRSVLHVYPGIYEIDRPLILDGLQLAGSYGGGSGRTVIRNGEYFRGGQSLIEVREGLGNVSGCSFTSSGESVHSAFYIRGNLYLAYCDIELSGSMDYFIVQDAGTLILESMDMTRSAKRGILKQNGGQARIISSRFVSDRPDDNEDPFFTSLNASLLLEKVSIDPGKGRKTQAFYGVDSILVAENSHILSGAGSISGSAVVTINGSLSLRNSRIQGSEGTRTLSLIDSFKTEININRTGITGNSLKGTALVNLNSCSTAIRYSQFDISGDSEFSFHVKAAGGTLEITNTVFHGNMSRDVSVLDLREMEAALIHNVIDVTARSRFAQGIFIQENKGTIIANNIIVNRGLTGTGIHADSVNNLYVQNNSIFGWSNFGVAGAKAAGTVRDLDLLDEDPLGGDIHANTSEDPVRTFKDDGIHLQETSNLVNRGSLRFRGGHDIDGEERPNPHNGIKPLPDPGVDEVYE